MRQSATTLFLAATLMAPLAAGVTLAVVAAGESPLESARPAEPVVSAVERAVRNHEASVAVTLVRAEPFTARTDAAGRITSVSVLPGKRVATGTIVATVSGRSVVAYQAERPLYTDVGSGSTAAVVTVAQEVLADLGGYEGPVDGKIGPATTDAIIAFNKAHGFGSSRVLELTGLTWIGPDSVVVAELLASPGEDVAPGAELFVADAPPAGVAVAATQPVAVQGPRVLEVAGSTVPMPDDSQVIEDPEFAAAVASAWGDVDEGVGVVRLAEPLEVGTVPSAAVVTDAQGRTCIFSDQESPGLVVTPLGGTLGTVDLDSALVGQPFLVNPRAVRQQLDCR